MPTARSRYLRSGQQTDFLEQLAKFLRRLVVRAPRQRKVRGHGDAMRTAHRAVYARGGDVGRRGRLVKQDISLWQLGIVVCVVLALMWLAWQIFAQTAALNLAGSDPDEALSWVSDQGAALRRVAQRELSDPHGKLDTAAALAKRALRSNPMDSRALTLLALIAERKGDAKTADALMQIAGARTWRDHESQAWLFNRDFRHGDYAQALAHADAILRMNSEWQAELFPVLAALTVDAQAFKDLTDFLATSPPWRTWFLSQLSARLANQARLIQLYAALDETEKPPTKQELRPYLDRLIKDGNFDQAKQTWHDTLSREQRVSETYPFNRDFDLPIDGLPFNWNLETVPGAEIQIVPAADGGGKSALLVQFSGARVSFANVKQLMLLSAGDYSFRGRVKAEELVTTRGLWWTIFCADSVAKTLAHTELVSGTLPWSDFAVNFQVPATDCEAQWLQLELPARIEPEKKIAGQVWYQQLRIAPNPAPAKR
jgi:hypothetical protein